MKNFTGPVKGAGGNFSYFLGSLVSYIKEIGLIKPTNDNTTNFKPNALPSEIKNDFQTLNPLFSIGQLLTEVIVQQKLKGLDSTISLLDKIQPNLDPCIKMGVAVSKLAAEKCFTFGQAYINGVPAEEILTLAQLNLDRAGKTGEIGKHFKNLNDALGVSVSNIALLEKKTQLKAFPNLDSFLLGLPLEVNSDGIFYAEPQPYYKPSQISSCGTKKCIYGRSAFMNGMLCTFQDALITTEAMSKMQGGHFVDLIYSSSLGLSRDIRKHYFIKNHYLIPQGKLFKDYIINYFENAAPHEVLHINLHSQGGAIFKEILPEIPADLRDRMYIDTYGTADLRDRMYIDTYGTAGYIPKEMAKQVRNIWHPNDVISKLSDFKGWREAKKNGSLVILENDKKSPLKAHQLMDGYKKRLQENNAQFAQGDF